MKNNSKKIQPKVAEIEETEMTIISDENNTSELLVADEEIINEIDNIDEVTLEVTDDDLDFTEPLDEDVEVDLPFDNVKTPPVKDVALAERNLRIKALKRAIENKTMAINREITKVRDWRSQATEMLEKASLDYNKRKLALEESLLKAKTQFDKKNAKVQKWWIEYSDTYEKTKILKLNTDLAMLQKELSKVETLNIEIVK